MIKIFNEKTQKNYKTYNLDNWQKALKLRHFLQHQPINLTANNRAIVWQCKVKDLYSNIIEINFTNLRDFENFCHNEKITQILKIKKLTKYHLTSQEYAFLNLKRVGIVAEIQKEYQFKKLLLQKRLKAVDDMVRRYSNLNNVKTENLSKNQQDILHDVNNKTSSKKSLKIALKNQYQAVIYLLDKFQSLDLSRCLLETSPSGAEVVKINNIKNNLNKF